MPAPVITSSITEDVLNNNISAKCPDDVYDSLVRPLLKEIKQYNIDPYTIKFDPDRHLLYKDEDFDKTVRKTLAELGCTKFPQEPISEIGLSMPFPLFTDECVAMLRWELFQEETFKKWARLNRNSTTGDKDMNIRGQACDKSCFTNQAWTHPRTQAIINKMCGVELTPIIELDVGNTNVCLRSPESQIIDEGAKHDADKIPAIVSWHNDSPQFVCVMMMSDTTKMIGGETAIMVDDGTVIRAEGPKRGWATILQGRILKHMATKPRGEYTERIAQLCSYRPVDVMLDKSPITTVKPSVLTGTFYNDFYHEQMNYRIDVLSARLEILRKKINSDHEKGVPFNQMETIEFLKEKINLYANESWQEFEVVDDGLVPKPDTYNVKQAKWW